MRLCRQLTYAAVATTLLSGCGAPADPGGRAWLDIAGRIDAGDVRRARDGRVVIEVDGEVVPGLPARVGEGGEVGPIAASVSLGPHEVRARLHDDSGAEHVASFRATAGFGRNAVTFHERAPGAHGRARRLVDWVAVAPAQLVVTPDKDVPIATVTAMMLVDDDVAPNPVFESVDSCRGTFGPTAFTREVTPVGTWLRATAEYKPRRDGPLGETLCTIDVRLGRGARIKNAADADGFDTVTLVIHRSNRCRSLGLW